MGILPAAAFTRYAWISLNLLDKPDKPLSFCLICNAKLLVEGSLISRNKCSTPTSSASSASMEHLICLKTFCISFPSASISSTASYAVVGIPSTLGRTSIMTNTGSQMQNCPNNAFIFKSLPLILGPTKEWMSKNDSVRELCVNTTRAIKSYNILKRINLLEHSKHIF